VLGGFPSGAFTTSASLVSASSSGVPSDRGGQQPSISSDGRWVAFASTSTNLTSTPNGGVQQIYLRDTYVLASPGCTPSTTLVSFDGSGNPSTGDSQLPAIGDDGRFVVFTTQVPVMGVASPVMSTNATPAIHPTDPRRIAPHRPRPCPSASAQANSLIPTVPTARGLMPSAATGDSSHSRPAPRISLTKSPLAARFLYAIPANHPPASLMPARPLPCLFP
jgi:hypothetical protein